MCPFEFESPDDASARQAIPFVVRLRPISNHDHVGEHSAVT
jgi:hypothetical protein